MPEPPAHCAACGRDFDDTPLAPAALAAAWQPDNQEPKNFVERGLQEHNRLLAALAAQLETLPERLAAGTAADGELRDLLETLRQTLRPRHGLCIDGNCVLCRVQEDAIKEHVVAYIEWKVPGTTQKLQQTRQRN